MTLRRVAVGRGALDGRVVRGVHALRLEAGLAEVVVVLAARQQVNQKR